jgi:GNAT superfamily N-acetyltransferase
MVASDINVMRAIERDAGEGFRTLGMDTIADDEPPSPEDFAAYGAAGRAWVAVGTDNEPVGYLLVDEVDEAAHIEQVTVRRDRQGQGVGRALLAQAGTWARQRGRTALTLTTFDEVPWNRPLYEHLGFRVLAEAEVGPELHALQAAEAIHGLDIAPRVAMRRDVSLADPALPSSGHAG